MYKRLLLLLIPFSVTYSLFAQQATPDTATLHSTVRTLTDQQYTAIIRGTDLKNMALVAEMNHYPLPDLIIQYKKELDLSPTQITQINAVVKLLRLKKLEVGQSVIRNEKMLDSIFKTRQVDEGQLIFYGNRYGLYEGEYRTAILLACYKTAAILTPRQIKRLEGLKKHD